MVMGTLFVCQTQITLSVVLSVVMLRARGEHPILICHIGSRWPVVPEVLLGRKTESTGLVRGSESQSLRLIPIEDIVVDPVPSSSEASKYHKAPVASSGVMEVDNEDLDLAEEKPGWMD